MGSVSVCVIDDSLNRDVPLFDFSLVDIQAEHHLQSTNQGVARGVFAGDYYNRGISSWEPVIENWGLVRVCVDIVTTLLFYVRTKYCCFTVYYQQSFVCC